MPHLGVSASFCEKNENSSPRPLQFLDLGHQLPQLTTCLDLIFLNEHRQNGHNKPSSQGSFWHELTHCRQRTSPHFRNMGFSFVFFVFVFFLICMIFIYLFIYYYFVTIYLFIFSIYEIYCQNGFHTTPSAQPKRCPPQYPSPTLPSLPPPINSQFLLSF